MAWTPSMASRAARSGMGIRTAGDGEDRGAKPLGHDVGAAHATTDPHGLAGGAIREEGSVDLRAFAAGVQEGGRAGGGSNAASTTVMLSSIRSRTRVWKSGWRPASQARKRGLIGLVDHELVMGHADDDPGGGMEDLRAEDSADALGRERRRGRDDDHRLEAEVASPTRIGTAPAEALTTEIPAWSVPSSPGSVGRSACSANSVVRRWVSEPVSRTSRVVRPADLGLQHRGMEV